MVCVGPNVLDVADIEVLKVVFNQDRGQWRKVRAFVTIYQPTLTDLATRVSSTK